MASSLTLPDPRSSGGGGGNNNGGEISITLASPDETAQVRIAVTNPDLVAEKMVSQLAKTFPPESVMTIAANDDDVSSAADTTMGTDRGDNSSRLPTIREKGSPKHRKNPPKPDRQSRDYVEERRYTSHTRRGRRGKPQKRYEESGEEYYSDDGNEEEYYDDEEESVIEKPQRPKKRSSSRPNRARSRGRSPQPTIALTQEYFNPSHLDHAIPVAPGQTSVKLINDRKLQIDRGRCFTVDHDFRGLPVRWCGLDGRRREWAPSSYRGVGIKFQDYVVHPDLVYGVPITAGQRELSVSDGGELKINKKDIVTVFYDANGHPVFSYDGRKKKIRPGLIEHPGIASYVRYYMLIDCDDGTNEQYVIPFTGHQKEVPNPFKSGGPTIPVDHENVTVVFYDKSRQSLYTQLSDGSLLSGGLTGHDDISTISSYQDESEYIYSLSESGGPVPRVKLNGDHLVMTNIAGVGGPEKRSKSRPDERETSMTSSSLRRQEIIERRVPVPQVQFVEKIVEVPEIHFVEKHVEVEKVEWETKIVKKKQIVERPVEHIKYVPKIETKIVERIINVPEIIEVPRPEIIEQKIPVDRFVDEKKEIVVSQKLVPQIRDGGLPPLMKEIECLRLEPELIPVDVFVPKLVRNQLLAGGKGEVRRTEVDVPLSHYNSLVLRMNPQFASNYEKLPLVKTSKGSFPLLPAETKITVPEPTEEEIFQFLKATGLVGGTI